MNISLQVPSQSTTRIQTPTSASQPTSPTSTSKYGLTSPTHSRYIPSSARSPKSNIKSPKSQNKEDEVIWRTSRAKEIFKQFDTNKDRYLQKDEFVNGLQMFLSLKVDAPKSSPRKKAKKERVKTNESENDAAKEITAQGIPEAENTKDATCNEESKEESVDASATQVITKVNESLSPKADATLLTPKAPLSQIAIDALWMETDIDGDNKISLEEFLYRFADGNYPTSLLKSPKNTQILQAKPVKLGTGSTLTSIDLKAVLLNLYDGNRMRFPSVDLSKCEQVSVFVLKKMLTEIVAAEKAEADEQKRPLEAWAQRVTDLGGINSKNTEKFFKTLDAQKIGRVDLAPIFAACKLLPPTRRLPGKGKSKKTPKKKAFPFRTVLEKSFTYWLNDAIFNHIRQEYYQDIKCHPSLKHWGEKDRAEKALLTNGYETNIFLSERTKILLIIESSDSQLQDIFTKQPGLQISDNNQANIPITEEKKPRTKKLSTAKKIGSNSKSTKKAKAVRNETSFNEIKSKEKDSFHYVFFLTRSELTKKCRRETLWLGYVMIDKEEKITAISSIQRRIWKDSEVDRTWEENIIQLESIHIHTNEDDDENQHETSILNVSKFCSQFNFAIWDHFIKDEPEKQELPIPITTASS